MKINGILKFTPANNEARREIVKAFANAKTIARNIAQDDGAHAARAYVNNAVGNIIRYVG